MERAEITQLCERQVLGTVAQLFGASQEALGKFDDYEGCANLVYHYENAGQPRIPLMNFGPPGRYLPRSCLKKAARTRPARNLPGWAS